MTPDEKAIPVSTVLSVPYEASGARVARRFVEQFATGLGFDGAADDLCLIVTELVTNAIVHGKEPVELTLRYEHGEVTIEVADGDSQVEGVTPHADQVEPGGRGLRIVASLADEWGTRPSHTGKTVWATTTHTAAP